MHSFSLKLPGFDWWWVPLFVGMIGLLIWTFLKSQKITTRPVSKILLILRSLILILLTVLLLKPEFHWISNRKKSPSALIWIDNSLSIAAQTNVSQDSLLYSIQQLDDAFSAKGIKPRYFLFDENVRPVGGKLKSIQFDGIATDIANVFQTPKDQFSEDNVVGAVLVTDGIFTRGEDPAFMQIDTPFPIFTIGIGDSDIVLDPAVTKIDLPQSVSAGDTLIVNSEIIPAGNGEPLTIFLKDGEKILQKQIVQSQPQSLKKAVAFRIVASEPGEKTFSVEITAGHDRNPYNNFKMSTVKILESKIRILIVSGRGNFEARFLVRSLSDLKNIEILSIIENDGKWLPSQLPEILSRRWNAMVLIGYPTIQSGMNDLVNLRRKITDSNLPVIIFLDSNTSIGQLEKILGWNPVAECSIEKVPGQINVECTREGANHPVIRNFQRNSGEEQIWRTLPPIGMPYKKVRLIPMFLPLIKSTNLAENPVISVSNEPNKHLAICIGSDYWRWSFMTQEAGRIDLYDELFQGLTKWLADTLSSSAIQMAVNKRIFLTGETVEITGLLRDLKDNVLSNARMKAELLNKDKVLSSINLNWDGQRFIGVLPVKASGNCRIRLLVWKEEELIGTREQEISVVNQPIELMEVRQNASLLRAIALKTGGKKVNLDEVSDVVPVLKSDDKIVRRDHSLKFLRWKWSLILIVILLITEWSIRRFYGYQ